MDANTDPGKPRRWPTIRPYLLFALAAAGVAFTLLYVNRVSPLRHWLFWRFGLVYLLTAAFGAACLVIGHALTGRLTREDPLPLRERGLMDATVGVLCFATATFLVGLCHGLGAIYFFALPVACLGGGLALGGRGLGRIARRIRAHRTRARAPLSLVATLAIAFGAVGILLLYLPTLTTLNLAYDARWYHLAIAEHYAAAGAIAAFPEGFYLASYPHLGSWLYTWAMTCPILDAHGRILLAAHLEWLLFLGTLAGIPLVVERLVAGRRVRGSWALLFAFPGIYIYDSNLIVGADHVLAFFALPLALAALRFVRAPSPARGVLLAMAMAGAALSKAQAVYLLAPTVLLVGVGAAVHLARGRATLRHLAYVLAWPLSGSFLVLTASYWLANLVWHHNPLYPFLSGVFPSRPWRTVMGGLSPDPGWTPDGTFLERVGQTMAAPFTFAFVPHTWGNFQVPFPLFGFLFTLALPFLPFLRGTRRAAILAAASVLGVAIWFWTFHQERYLQALLPWMVACTAALFALAWRTGWAARLGVAGLVAMQLIYGGDAPFLPTHAMVGGSAVEQAVRLLGSTYRKDHATAIRTQTGFEAVRQALPPDSTVLLHLEHLRLGIGRPVVTDNPRWSGAPLLGSFATLGGALAHLQILGVTHLLHRRAACHFDDLDLQSEVAFHFLAERETTHREVDGWRIDKLPGGYHTVGPGYGPVTYLGCGHRGQVEFAALDATWDADRSKSPSDMNQLAPADAAMFDGALSIVVDDRCAVDFPPGIADRFTRATHWREATLWIRKRGQ